MKLKRRMIHGMRPWPSAERRTLRARAYLCMCIQTGLLYHPNPSSLQSRCRLPLNRRSAARILSGWTLSLSRAGRRQTDRLGPQPRKGKENRRQNRRKGKGNQRQNLLEAALMEAAARAIMRTPPSIVGTRKLASFTVMRRMARWCTWIPGPRRSTVMMMRGRLYGSEMLVGL